MIIRQETPGDHPAVFELLTAAFANEPMSDQREQFLVERLRRAPEFVPELSLVAERKETIVGYILLTEISIENGRESYPSLSLAPVAVLPGRQGEGIGSTLIRRAHAVAKDLGYRSVVVLGHETYYPRFGYQRCDRYGISLPFEVPPENCMVLELRKGGLKGVSGTVRYPAAFGE